MKIVSDSANWSLDDDASFLKYHYNIWLSENNICSKLKPRFYFVSRDSVFKFPFNIAKSLVPFALDFYHGDLFHDPQYLKYLRLFSKFSAERGARLIIRVSNTKMHKLFLDSFLHIPVYKIPIPVDIRTFSFKPLYFKQQVREDIGIPDNSFVVGSFQKDGIGWGSGDKHKIVKGPDLLLSSLQRLKCISSRPLFVLLTGPSRGYVKKGLEYLGIPYSHSYLSSSDDLPPYYSALDVYAVTSRDEGGPKAILEAMACGIPIVSTNVGQAPDLIHNGLNGFLCESDPISISSALESIQSLDKQPLIENGLITAKKYHFTSNQLAWNKLFTHLHSL